VVGVRKGVYGIASTAIAGLGNVLVQILVAVFATTEEFGRFALAAATVLLILGFGRMVVGQTDLLRGAPGRDVGATGAAWLLGLALIALGGAVAAVAVFIGVELMTVIGCAIAVSSVFVLQDAARFRSFRVGTPGLAFVSDVVVLLASLGGVLAAGIAGLPGDTALWVWSGATLLGYLAIAIPTGVGPSLPEGWRWMRAHRDLVLSGSGEYTLQAGLPYLLNWLIVALGGLAAVAGYRLAQLAFAATSNLAQGLNAVSMRDVVNGGDPRLARRVLNLERLALLAAGLALFILVLAIPESWGVAIFGVTWTAMGAFALPAAVHSLAIAFAIAGFSMLRLLGFLRFSFIVRVGSTVATILIVALTVTAGPVGVAWALAITAVGAFAVREWRVRRELGRLITAGALIPRGENPHVEAAKT